MCDDFLIQRACIYVPDINSLHKIIENDPYLLQIASRFRMSVLISDENNDALTNPTKNSVIKVHEAWPLSLSFLHTSNDDSSPITRSLYISEQPVSVWIMEFDAWFLLPDKIKESIDLLAAHVYFFNQTNHITKL